MFNFRRSRIKAKSKSNCSRIVILINYVAVESKSNRNCNSHLTGLFRVSAVTPGYAGPQSQLLEVDVAEYRETR